MKSLAYLMLHTAKNRILMVRRKPAMLILYLLFIGFIVLSMWGSGHTDVEMLEMRADLGWLKLIFMGYMALFAVTSVHAGLSSGASVFDMPDVNFLFTSPVNPKQILVYGLMRQAIKSIFASVFILMMGATLKNFFGIEYGGLLILFAAYVIGLVLFQFISVVIYMYAAGHPRVKTIVAVVAVAMLIPLAVSILLPYLQGTPITESLLAAMDSTILYTLPVIGWLTIWAFAAIAGNWTAAIIAIGLVVAAACVCFVLLTAGKTDYYEDVLVATETTFQKQRAVAEGNLQASQATSRKIRVGKQESGEVWGRGASAFFGKHMLENFRKNRLKLLDVSSFSFIITAVAMAFFMREYGDILMILTTTMFMRMFLVGTGLGLRELYTHYIFMVPASSFSKIVWSNLELAIKSLIESILAFGISGVLLGAPVLDTVMCIVVTAVFTLLLVAVNLLSMRIFANVISQGLLMFLYIFFVIIVMIPGVVAAFILALAPWGSVALALAALTVWELLMSALFFFLSRGVLDTCDIETAQKPTK